MSASDTDSSDVSFETATEVLTDDESSDQLFLEEGDQVRVHDVHPTAPILYREARIGRVWGIKHNNVLIDLLDGDGDEVASVAIKVSDMMGVTPRGF